MDITVQTTSEDVASKLLRVTVPVERVRQAEQKALRYFTSQARMPGFRQGKIPEGVVRKRFADQIRQSVLEEAIREGWQRATESSALKPVTQPHVENVTFEDGKPLEFDIHVEVRPEFALEKTGGFSLTKTVAAPTEEQIDEQLDRVREQRAQWVPVEGQKPAPGQQVNVAITPLGDDVVSEPQSYTVELGSGQALKDLEELIMSLAPGETTEGDVRFPDDHPDEKRRGTARRVRVTLEDVKQKELPDANDAFAREVGDFESVAALRDAIRADIQRHNEREADGEVRRQLVEQVAAANGVTAPESFVKRVIEGYRKMYEVPEEQLGTFTEQFRPMAEWQVKRDVILDILADREGLRATEADVDARVNEMAEARKVSAGQLYAQLQKANRLQELELSITEEKVYAWLLSQSTVAQS